MRHDEAHNRDSVNQARLNRWRLIRGPHPRVVDETGFSECEPKFGFGRASPDFRTRRRPRHCDCQKKKTTCEFSRILQQGTYLPTPKVFRMKISPQKVANYLLISLLISPTFTAPRRNDTGARASILAARLSPALGLLACPNAALRKGPPSLPIPGALMGTSSTSGQAHRTPSSTPQCTQRLTITSTPCGASIYIDDMQSGQTPITFPMPPGRYTVVLFAPGHQPFAQRILISDGPLEVKANLIPLP